MSDTVIRVENLSKKYVLSHQQEGQQYKALRDVIADGAKAIGQKLLKPSKARTNPNREEFWALKDVSFEIKQGDRVGIIGRNGAGKSTLLKVLSRIVEPTSGSIGIRGRVASLLEVGTGFHPELTGRENVYLNGAILGMSREEIKRKFDEIVAFAEVERFLDTPVKRYSSGMYVRLAFAVAAHLEPEVLIVDEVLAVGDADFQKKCLGKMEEVGAEGRTVIFVSHSMATISRLCHKSVWLNRGQVTAVGDTATVVASYLSSGAEVDGEWRCEQGENAPGNGEIYLQAIRILDEKKKITAIVNGSEDFYIEIEYEILSTIESVKVGFLLLTFDGIPVLAAGDIEDPNWFDGNRTAGYYKSVCKIPGQLLNSGLYTLAVAAHRRHFEQLFSVENLIQFQVELTRLPLHTPNKPPGILCLPLEWRVTQANKI